jgi:hypothetical protein
MLAASVDRTPEFFILARVDGGAKSKSGAAKVDVEQSNRTKAYARVRQVMAGVQTTLTQSRVFELALAATKRAKQAAQRANNVDQMAHFAVVENDIIEQEKRAAAVLEETQRREVTQQRRIVEEPKQSGAKRRNERRSAAKETAFQDGEWVFRELPNLEAQDAAAMQEVQVDLERKSKLYSQLQEHVDKHAERLDVVEKYVQKIDLNLHSSSAILTDANGPTYLTRRARLMHMLPVPRTATEKVRCSLFLFLASCFALFAFGVI